MGKRRKGEEANGKEGKRDRAVRGKRAKGEMGKRKTSIGCFERSDLIGEIAAEFQDLISQLIIGGLINIPNF